MTGVNGNTNLLLNQIRDTIAGELVERSYMLPMPPEEGMQGTELEVTVPKVVIGNIPHENFGIYALDNRYMQAPYVLVGIEKSIRDYDSMSRSLLIQACCYATGQYSAGDENRFPDNLAFMDCNNLLETVEEILMQSDIPLTMPVELGDYSQKAHTYPLAYGYLKCSVEVNEPFENRKFEYY